MIKRTLVACVFILLVQSIQVTDSVECFRMRDSSYGHFVSCSASKPMPLKVQTTFNLDKDFTWGIFAYDVALYDGVQKKTTSLSKCLQGSPGVGNKTAGMNLTLATTCNVLPRQLRQYDMVRYEVHFPNSQWLVWAVPIPGYTTHEDVQIFMNDQQFSKKTILSSETQYKDKSLGSNFKQFLTKVKKLKNIRYRQ